MLGFLRQASSEKRLDARFRDAADARHDYIIVLARDGTILFINRPLRENWPLTFHFSGTTVWDALPDVVQTEAGRFCRAALRGWQPTTGTIYGRTSRNWYSVTAEPASDFMVFTLTRCTKGTRPI